MKYFRNLHIFLVLQTIFFSIWATYLLTFCYSFRRKTFPGKCNTFILSWYSFRQNWTWQENFQHRKLISTLLIADLWVRKLCCLCSKKTSAKDIPIVWQFVAFLISVCFFEPKASLWLLVRLWLISVLQTNESCSVHPRGSRNVLFTNAKMVICES